MSQTSKVSARPLFSVLAIAGLSLSGLVAASQADGASAVPLNRCAEPDNGFPVIDGVSFEPPAVDVTEASSEVTMTVRVHDTGGPGDPSGVRHILTEVRAEDGPRLYLDLDRKTAQSFSATFTVPRHARAGAWKVDGLVRLEDAAGNDAVDDRDPDAVTQAALDAGVLTVTSTPDTTAPVVSSFDLPTRHVDTRTHSRQVPVVVHATDDDAGVQQVLVQAARHRHIQSAALHRKEDGSFRGSLTIPRWQGTGDWKVQRIDLLDKVGNQALYSRGRLDSVGDPEFAVRSGDDTAEPRLEKVRTRPTPVDIRRHGRTVHFAAHIRDRGAGVDTGEIAFAGRSIALKRTDGSRRHGVWSGSMRLGRCQTLPRRAAMIVRATDRADNEMEVLGPRVRVRSADHAIRGVSRSTSTLARRGPLALRFREAVNGIGARSAPVRPGTGGPGLAGSWRCFNAHDHHTSCRTGKVRRATWRPDHRLAAHSAYLLVLNPEHNLGIRDLAGNPFRRERLSWSTR
ncbi:hypothetical protein [Nocardioides terrisoli]|uniref:hypothetical protein n=1 Tax=Nocardioides terrisoli TaxID=3388267 RepID=UPI00287BBA32|nr:hypothetical protein [Nocardioides marmorisolisilvae]